MYAAKWHEERQSKLFWYHVILQHEPKINLGFSFAVVGIVAFN